MHYIAQQVSDYLTERDLTPILRRHVEPALRDDQKIHIAKPGIDRLTRWCRDDRENVAMRTAKERDLRRHPLCRTCIDRYIRSLVNQANKRIAGSATERV